MYLVTVHEGYRWASAKVDGRTFSKATPTEMTDADMTDEIRNHQALTIKIVVEEPEPSADEIDATDEAKQLAANNGIDLATVTGTGKDGRILKSDVEALIGG